MQVTTEHKIAAPEHRLVLNILFVLFVCMVLFTRVVIFFRYNMYIIDTDQPYMWLGASDYAKGLFYEPRYYGQDYNTFMEGLFAVPLLWVKVPVYYALPLATHFISLFPFLFTAFYLFFKQKKIYALLMLAIILCLPAPYDLLNGLPRGFVTGVFFASFFIVNILDPHNIKFVFINTLLAVVGYFVNQTVTLVSVPFLIYIFLHNYKSIRYYVVSVPCLLLAWPLDLLFNQFYRNHPDYIQNDLKYRISTGFFVENISALDKRFAHISFFFENNSLLLIFALLVFGVMAFLYRKKIFWSFLGLIAVILFSFCVGKTQEGSVWAYMSYSRMYLGIPFFLGLFLPAFNVRPNKILLASLLVPLFFSTYKLATIGDSLDKLQEKKRWSGVRLITMKSAFEIMDFYKGICDKNDVNFLLVSHEFWQNTILVYGGHAIYDKYPETQETLLEKRYWVRQKNQDRVIKNFVMISKIPDLHKRMPKLGRYEIEKLDDYGLLLIKNNAVKMGEFIDLVNTFENR